MIIIKKDSAVSTVFIRRVNKTNPYAYCSLDKQTR